MKELAIEDTAEYKNMMRMSHAVFQRILSYIEQDITRKQVLGGNKVISPNERLALTITFLTTGETYRSLSYQFRISTRAISYIIKEVCEAKEFCQCLECSVLNIHLLKETCMCQ